MTHLITKTKVLAPRRQHNLLRRSHLLEQLESMVGARLALIVAPAGYGKTSALIDWADATSRVACWYTVDILDEDATRFVAHWFAAIHQQFPRFGLESNAILQAYAEQQATLDQVIAVAVNELYDTVEEEFLLIIDDYHLVDGVAEIGYFVSRFVQNVAPNCQVVLASRKLLSLPNLALLVARSQVQGLDETALAFTPGEVQALVRIRFQQEITQDQAVALVESTEGWITGLLLSAQSSPESLRLTQDARSVGVDLYDYLAQQVLEQQPAELRCFLLRTAVLEEFDAELCASVFPPDWLPPGRTWDDLVEEVLAKGLFVSAVGHDRTWLRFHRLFQEFLLYRLSRERPDEETLILRALAEWLRTRQEWERAYHIYQRLQDQPAVARLVVEAGRTLIKVGRAQLAEKWTAALSNDLIRTHPELMSIRAAALVLLGRVQEGHTLLDRAVARLEPGGGRWYLRSLAWRGVIYRFLGDYSAALAEGNAALEVARTFQDDEREVAEICADCYKTIGICHYRLGDLVAAQDAIQEAQSLYEIAGTAADIASVHVEMAVIQLALGDLHGALTEFEFAADSWRRLGQIQQLSLALNNLGVVYHRQGRLALAVETYAEALHGAERSAHRRTEAVVCASLGDVFVDLGFYSAAAELCSRSARVAAEIDGRFFEIYANLQLAWLAALSGEEARTFDFINLAGERIVANPSPYEHALYQLTVGRVHLLAQQPSMALEVLKRALTGFETAQHVAEAVVARLWIAAAWAAVEDFDAAREEMQSALDQLETLESHFFAYVAAQPIQAWLRQIRVDERHAALHEEFSFRLSETRRQLGKMRRIVRQSAPEQIRELLAVRPELEIRALGRTEVLLRGRYIGNSEWKTLVSRDMFYCLMAHPEGLSREEIGAIFWPEASPDQLRTRFKNSIYRLRSAIGADAIVYEDDLYRFNQALDYESDVDGFLQNLYRAEELEEPEKKIRALVQALSYYKGEFCPEIEDEWAWIERQALDSQFRDALSQLASLYLQLERFPDALDVCEKMLAVDNCWEEAHRLAMQAHAATGNRAAVARQFDACQKVLHAEIAAEPSPQTERLYLQLMASAAAPS